MSVDTTIGYPPRITGKAVFTAKDVDANAKMNFVEVQLGNGDSQATPGTGGVQDEIRLQFKDPNNSGLITFAELRNGLRDTNTILQSPVKSGSANFSLPVRSELPWTTIASNPGVKITWSNLYDDGTKVIDFGSSLKELADFGSITHETIKALLGELESYLNDIGALSLLDREIPSSRRRSMI